MSMTLEEAIKLLKQYQGYDPMFPDGETLKHAFDLTDETVDTLLAALRPVSREQVERIRGEWVAKHRHRGGFRRVTGVDDMGEQRTITIDERCEYDDRYCSRCGKQSPDNFLNFCGYCGAPMTDEAVDMMLERWKEALDENT